MINLTTQFKPVSIQPKSIVFESYKSQPVQLPKLIYDTQIDQIPELKLYDQKQSDTSISVIDKLTEEGVHFKITSGYRPGAKTAQGKSSNHSKTDDNGNPLAYDIVPAKGYTFEDLKKEIYDNPDLVQYFKDKHLGILEENKKSIASVTHATGPHFHIGPDSWAIKMFNDNIKKGQYGMKFDDLADGIYPADDDDDTEDTNKIQGLQDLQSAGPLSIIYKKQDKLDNNNLEQFIEALNYNPIKNSNFDMSSTESSDSNLLDIGDEAARLIDAQEKARQIQLGDYQEGTKEYKGNQKELLSKTIDTLGTKDPDILRKKDFLMRMAATESGYKLNVSSNKSTASGWFGFLNSNKKFFAPNVSVSAFNNSPETQIEAASKMYDYVLAQARHYGAYDIAKQKNYSDDDIAAAYWLSPKWATQFFINGTSNQADANGTTVPKKIEAVRNVKKDW